MQGILRDFLRWENFLPGATTLGGTVEGSVMNPGISIGGVLAINSATGDITVTLPAAPTGTTSWAVTLRATLEAISPNGIPSSYQPMYTSFTFVNSTSTVNFNDADWGNFVAWNSGPQTATTEAHLACLPGTVTYTINTSGVMTHLTSGAAANLKLHFSVDAVAY